MRHLVLLYGDETALPPPGSDEFMAQLPGYMAFGELAAGAIVGGDALHLQAGTRTVRLDGGSVSVTNGPFADTVEGLGGFYVLDVPTLDDAIELARHIPTAQRGAIEIRPLIEFFDRSADVVPAAEGETRFLATIHGQAELDGPGDPEWEAMGAAHGQFTDAAGDAVHAGGAVQPSSNATTIRVRDGELSVTDGPCAGVPTLTGGFYVLRGTEDGVADVAAKIPVGDGGIVVLSPILELGG